MCQCSGTKWLMYKPEVFNSQWKPQLLCGRNTNINLTNVFSRGQPTGKVKWPRFQLNRNQKRGFWLQDINVLIHWILPGIWVSSAGTYLPTVLFLHVDPTGNLMPTPRNLDGTDFVSGNLLFFILSWLRQLPSTKHIPSLEMRASSFWLK